MYQNKVFIALGSNIGNWKNNFNQAFHELSKIGFINNFSSIFLSKPYGYTNQNLFYNTAIEFVTRCDPNTLLRNIQTIEKKMLKKKIFINGPRRIDLDIIFFNKIIMQKKYLTIPHPQAHLRDFVLLPMKEMNPFFVHPGKKKTINNLISNLTKKYIIKKFSYQRGSLLIY